MLLFANDDEANINGRPVDRRKCLNFSRVLLLLSSSSSAFALCIERFAYYCGFYFAPFSNSDFGYIVEGESTSGCTLLQVWDILLALAFRHSGTWNLGFTFHS
jgi:hypothetical protein